MAKAWMVMKGVPIKAKYMHVVWDIKKIPQLGTVFIPWNIIYEVSKSFTTLDEWYFEETWMVLLVEHP